MKDEQNQRPNRPQRPAARPPGSGAPRPGQGARPNSGPHRPPPGPPGGRPRPAAPAKPGGGHGWKPYSPNGRRPDAGGRGKTPYAGGHGKRPRAIAPQTAPSRIEDLRLIEREAAQPTPAAPAAAGPFRIVIAVHRPRYRGRCLRASALTGWVITALLNKQDPVGLVAKSPGPPDLLVLSGDFGRQRDYAIFRAVQPWRERGMKLIGLVDDCAARPAGSPDLAVGKLCDACLPPPYRAADLRAVFAQYYEQMRGLPAPPPLTGSSAIADQGEEADDE